MARERLHRATPSWDTLHANIRCVSGFPVNAYLDVGWKVKAYCFHRVGSLAGGRVFTFSVFCLTTGGETEEEIIRVDILENQVMDFRMGFAKMCYSPDFVSFMVCAFLPKWIGVGIWQMVWASFGDKYAVSGLGDNSYLRLDKQFFLSALLRLGGG